MPADTTAQFTTTPAALSGGKLRQRQAAAALTQVEAALVGLTLAIGLLALALSWRFDQAVAWDKFMISFAPSLGMVLLGCYVRLQKDMPRAAMAAIGAGIYIGFSGVITILIYLRFPFDAPTIDAQLMQFDAAVFGYEWAHFTTALAAYPGAGKAMGWIYGTSLLQLFAVVFVLAFLGRSVALSRVLITGTLSLLMTVAIWWHWPSLGPSAYMTLSPQVETALGLVHGEAAGARLMQMAEHGNAVITPQIIMGTIAFPSYHTVMMCLAVGFVFGTRAFWPLLVLNLGMLPAILSHGGHHLSDMLGGFAVFALAAFIACKLVPGRP